MMCELFNNEKRTISVKDYDISIKFSEFADASYENKLDTLGRAYKEQNMSTTMYMQKLYGNTLSDSEWEREHKWLDEHHEARNDAINEGMAGVGGGGANIIAQQTGDGGEE